MLARTMVVRVCGWSNGHDEVSAFCINRLRYAASTVRRRDGSGALKRGHGAGVKAVSVITTVLANRELRPAVRVFPGSSRRRRRRHFSLRECACTLRYSIDDERLRETPKTRAIHRLSRFKRDKEIEIVFCYVSELICFFFAM